MALKTTWKVLALILHFYIKYSKFCNIARFLNAPPQVHTKILHIGTGSTEFRQRKVFEGVQYHVFDLFPKFDSGPHSYIESGPKVHIFQILLGVQGLDQTLLGPKLRSPVTIRSMYFTIKATKFTKEENCTKSYGFKTWRYAEGMHRKFESECKLKYA